MSKKNNDGINGFRVCRNGEQEPIRQQDKIKSRMFQFLKTKKGGRRK